jgi:hypothetical protein
MASPPIAKGPQADVRVFPERLPTSGIFCPTSLKAWITAGIFLLVLGIYLLSGPGRIDIVDGEIRFDVALNWLVYRRPIVTDTWIGPAMSEPGREGLRYSYYGAPASAFSIPLIWLGLKTGPPPRIPSSQFFFSLTSAIIGAGVAPILFLFYLELGLTIRRALAWSMVSSFATYIWPISTSTFDNAQHAFFALAAVYFGFVAARRKSLAFALAGGAMAGTLILYQTYFLLIVPALALSTLEWRTDAASSLPIVPEMLVGRLQSHFKRTYRTVLSFSRAAWEGPGDARSSCLRYGLFLTSVVAATLVSFFYNHARFGSWLETGQLRNAMQTKHPLWGNPLIGFLTLLISPGKSIFLYSPVLILGGLGISRLWRGKPGLVTAIATSSVLLVLFLSCMAFAGGDWCWGPRYLTPLLPLWALAFPFVPPMKRRRELVLALVVLGFCVQGLALSVENQRFFFSRGLDDFFWAEDPWCYFKDSALFARPGEALSLFDGAPASAHVFNTIPIPQWTTYSILGTPPNVPRKLAPIWMRNFQIFFLPRPWPLWMLSLPPILRPIYMWIWLTLFLGITALGAGLIYLKLPARE